MKYFYYVSYALSFQPPVNKDGTPQHNWCYIDRTMEVSKKINNPKRFLNLKKALFTKHNADFCQILSINLLGVRWFGKAPNIDSEDFSFNGCDTFLGKDVLKTKYK